MLIENYAKEPEERRDFPLPALFIRIKTK